MLLSPIIAEELAQPYCPSKCRPLQLEWKTGIPKFHLEIMAFNLHNVSWWVYCLCTFYIHRFLFIFFIYSLPILNLSFDSLYLISNIWTIRSGPSQFGDQISLKFGNRRGWGQKLRKVCGRPKWISNILMFHSFTKRIYLCSCCVVNPLLPKIFYVSFLGCAQLQVAS